MKKLWFLAVFVFILVGCGSAEIKLNNDGSGELIYKIAEDEYYASPRGFEKELKEMVESVNDEADEEVVVLKEVKEKDGILTAELTYKDIAAAMSSNIRHVTVSDILRYGPYLIEEMVDSEGNAIDLENEKIGDYTYLYFSENDFDEMTLEVPGEVKYISEGVELVEANKIATDNSSFTVIYEKKGSLNFGLIGLLAILLVVIAAFVLFKKGILSKKPSVQKETVVGGTVKDE